MDKAGEKKKSRFISATANVMKRLSGSHASDATKKRFPSVRQAASTATTTPQPQQPQQQAPSVLANMEEIDVDAGKHALEPTTSAMVEVDVEAISPLDAPPSASSSLSPSPPLPPALRMPRSTSSDAQRSIGSPLPQQPSSVSPADSPRVTSPPLSPASPLPTPKLPTPKLPTPPLPVDVDSVNASAPLEQELPKTASSNSAPFEDEALSPPEPVAALEPVPTALRDAESAAATATATADVSGDQEEPTHAVEAAANEAPALAEDAQDAEDADDAQDAQDAQDDDDDEDEEEEDDDDDNDAAPPPQGRQPPATPQPEKPATPPQVASTAAHPLLILTAAVARELDVLPQAPTSTEPAPQPWVYAPAHASVAPMTVCVVDPDGLWPFLETPLKERVAHLQTGGAKRAVFSAREALRGGAPASTFARYRAPYLHVGLIRCETLAEYTSTVRPRLKAFVEDVERREDPEWLLVLVESSKHSRKVFDKIKLEFSPARCCSASVFDQARGGGGLDFFKTAPHDKRKRAGAGDGQWGLVVGRIGTLLEKAQTGRFAKYAVKEQDANFCAHFIAVENLAFAYLQADKFAKALEMYDELEAAYHRLAAQGDALVEKMRRAAFDPGHAARPSALQFCFPTTVAASDDNDDAAQHLQAFPARVLDVTRFLFRDLVATSAVSHLQLAGYLFSRRVLLLLALGLPRLAAKTAVAFIARTRVELRAAYDADWDVVDAWVVAAALELVAATHGCAAVFASSVSASDRVAMSACQADMLAQAVAALDAVSDRAFAPAAEFVPALATRAHPRQAWAGWPAGLARALASPDVFKVLALRLLEAAAAHAVAAGRFRIAAAHTHRRGVLAADEGLLLDAARWWGGEPRPVLVDGRDPIVHDDWPSLRAVSALAVMGRPQLLEAVVPVADLVAVRREELFAAVARAFAAGEIASLPLAVEHAGTLAGTSKVRVRSMRRRGGPADAATEEGAVAVRVRYASLQQPDVFVSAEASREGGWVLSGFEPASEHGYFVPDEALCIVAGGKQARGVFLERSLLHIPEPELAANLALLAPAVVAAGCTPQACVVSVQGTVEVTVVCGSGLALVSATGAPAPATLLVSEGAATVWLKASNDYFGPSRVAVEAKDKVASASVSVETAFETRARALVRLDGTVLVALHVTALLPALCVRDVSMADPLGVTLASPSPLDPLPLVLGKGESVALAFVLETSAPERAGLRSLVPCKARAAFALGETAYVSEWDVPILIRRSRRHLAVAEASAPVDKAAVGYVWGDDDEEMEANDHPSLIVDVEDAEP